jgi:hypothetical protein
MAEAKFIAKLPEQVEEWAKLLAANSEDWVRPSCAAGARRHNPLKSQRAD